ncbi:hypothetical protein D1007_41367 [Hordeum vulgare]|uniref:Predicted protein n=1 Tax=Hordeum vulgare subsp. vulgare TaxID=112509 RepID=F2D4X8_HORVV|nr:uncharacterized protein LOC123398468 [Hordeum vulgare subsp. vulgare]KAE8785008.1 hypothetical protein D1007_41367 [Hordeum vulgare]KAI4989758.1 hypothetical protein ZWY2020_038121 [Hordeum vulgare]BAJ90149.1 predicted protein [Hordeum vulgare subsp. vulgare]
MGATSYERLSSPAAGSGRRGGGGGAWAALMRGLARLCAARRGRWAPARGMLVRARGRTRSWRGRRVAAGCGYDSEGYARNFDDGLWKAEEGAPWRAAGPAIGACRLARAAVSSVQ